MTTLLPRQLSIQDFNDARPPVHSETAAHCRYIAKNSKKCRRPPTQFSIELNQPVSCYPGSVFQGTVRIKLAEPLAAKCLKLVLKAAERLNYDVIMWGKPGKREGRLFAVRTILWGPACANESVWPILEAGEHNFPFMCEMPLVNYPPSFHHHFVACHFTMVASLERPGIRPFQTEPCHVPYLPVLETCPSKRAVAYHNRIKVLTHTVDISLPTLSLNVAGNTTLPIRICVDDVSTITHVHITLNRYLRVSHGKYNRTETWLIQQQEQRLSSSVTDIIFPISTVSPTLTYSNHCSIKYKLNVSVKFRNSWLSRKKNLVTIPLFFGTLDRGICAPANLMRFTDELVERDRTLLTKPKFLRPVPEDNFLPPYDPKRPPEYILL
ncbi:hypothetical protein DFQ28_000481 [Apophysomyces sp. BC1034]|nr:hypothetical protein DFQ30_000617 [Apophysomyces sp. BC1015]KAG0180864.1 hypothetical protein DFQ29_009940 [Apophysomyces sp. BC1021]KAG0191306.1 hypothetical protein DFQ28_000481 [Apophysomyces sp. BC1034]